MKGAMGLLTTEFRLFLREPVAAFFNLAFPVLIVVLFGSQFGGPKMIGPTGVARIDVLVPNTIALVIATTGLMSISMQVAVTRERGFLRRLAVTPAHPASVLVGLGGSFVAVTVAGIAGVVAVGAAMGASLPARPLVLAAAVVASSAALFGIGFLVAALVPTARVAQAVAPAVFFPMLFLSGMSVPRDAQSSFVQAVAEWLPGTHAVELLGLGWQGQPVPIPRSFLVLALVGIFSAVVGLRVFRWDTP